MYLKFLSILFIVLSYTSCSKEENNQEFNGLGEITLDLSESKLGESIVFMTYKNSDELEKNVKQSLEQLISDARQLIQEDKNITEVITDIKFHEGKAIITNVTYYNSEKKEIIESYKLNTATDSYQRDLEPYIAKCPEGYTELASCGNFNNPNECVSNAVAAFFTENLSSPGDCANVQVSVGTFSTKVYGKTC